MIEMIVGFIVIALVLGILLVISTATDTNVPDLLFGIIMIIFAGMAIIGVSIEIGRLVLSLF